MDTVLRMALISDVMIGFVLAIDMEGSGCVVVSSSLAFGDLLRNRRHKPGMDIR